MNNKVKLIWISLLIGIFLLTISYGQPHPDLCAELMDDGYGLIGDTLYPGTSSEIIVDGFVAGHRCSLEVMSACVTTGASYRVFRTPLGATEPDWSTSWLSMPNSFIDGGGDGELYKYTAAVTLAGDTAYSNPGGDPAVDLWLMHDWYWPDRVEGVRTYGNDSPPYIRVIWSRGTDSGSGIFKYYVYRATSGYLLDYITPDMTPIDSIYEDGRGFYEWRDYDLAYGDCYWYAVVPMDKAGWVRRTGNDRVRGCATEDLPPFPPCGILRPIDRYHTGSGITIHIDTDHCPPDPGEVIQYRFRMYPVYQDTGDLLIMDSSRVVETDWTSNNFYYFNTMRCSTYTFSAQARYLGGTTSPWSHLTAYDPLTTNDDEAPGCPDTIYATSMGEDGIYVHFEQDPWDDCGSGIMGYHLFRFPSDEFSSHLPLGIEDTTYRLWEYSVNETGVYHFTDDGSIMELDDNITYIYVISPYDRAGYTNWLNCPNSQADTATVDLGIAPPWGISLPTYCGDGEIECRFIDTTHCDAESVMFEWDATPYFAGGAAHVIVGPLGINEAASMSGVFDFTNPEDDYCHDDDTLTLTIHGLYETQWFIRASFIDRQGNVSDWSNTINSRIDNTAPTTSRVIYAESYADSVGEVDIKITWDPTEISDAGIGVDSVNIYRSTSIGDLGSVIAQVSKYDSVFFDNDPNPERNWHSNVYTIAPFDYLDHENTSGDQGYILESTLGDTTQHPPIAPVIDTIVVSHYLDEFTIYWSDPGPGWMTNRYTMRHAGDEDWLWIGDELLAPEEYIGAEYSHSATFPITKLTGGTHHYFTMYAEDNVVPTNESPWAEVFEFELPEELVETTTVHLSAGWNFISLPVYPDNNRGDVLFPGNLGIHEWNPSIGDYDAIVTLEPGHAYWVLMTSSSDYDLTGIPVIRVERTDVGPGWVTFGAPYDSTGVGLAGDGSGYDYSGVGWAALLQTYDTPTSSYEDRDRLYSGEGYWMLLSGVGDLVSETNWDASRSPQEDYFCEWSFPIQADNRVLEIGYSEKAISGLDRMDMPLPPPSPSGATQPYFIDEDGLRYLRDVNSERVWNIVVPQETELNWNSELLPDCRVRMIVDGREIDMKQINSITIDGQAKVVAGEVIPENYTLGANRPNPFNPISDIPFAIPEDSRVTISIYDVTGRHVKTVLDDELSAGQHSIRWDGRDSQNRDVPAGIYLYRMESGSFTAVRRMLLVK